MTYSTMVASILEFSATRHWKGILVGEMGAAGKEVGQRNMHGIDQSGVDFILATGRFGRPSLLLICGYQRKGGSRTRFGFHYSMFD